MAVSESKIDRYPMGQGANESKPRKDRLIRARDNGTPLTWDILAHHFRVTLGRVPVNQLGWAVEHGYPEVPSKGPRHSTGQPYPPRRVAASQLAYSKPWRYTAEKDRPHIRLGTAPSNSTASAKMGKQFTDTKSFWPLP